MLEENGSLSISRSPFGCPKHASSGAQSATAAFELTALVPMANELTWSTLNDTQDAREATASTEILGYIIDQSLSCDDVPRDAHRCVLDL